MNANDEPRTGPADLYARLNVSPDAPAEVIAAAYKALMRNTHPDLATDDADRSRREAASKALGEAHATLTDPARRQRYDDERRRREHLDAATRAAPDTGGTARPAPDDHHESAGLRTPPGPTVAARRRATAAYRANGREPSPAHRPEELREYDSLPVNLRYALWRSARRDPQWRAVRTTMLAARPRRLGVPLAWFGAHGAALHPASPLAKRDLLIGALVGGAAAAFTCWWYTFDLVYGRYLPAFAARTTEPGLVAVALIVVISAVLAAGWTATFWPSLRRYRRGRLRFALRATVAFVAVLAAPVIALALALAGVAAVLITAFSPQR